MKKGYGLIVGQLETWARI